MPSQGWLVGEFRVGIGNGTHTGDDIVMVEMKMVDLPEAGTYVFAPDDARSLAKYLNAAVDKIEEDK